MGTARIILLVVAAFAAIGAAILVNGLLSSNKGEKTAAAPSMDVTEVLVAAKDLGLGTKLTAQDVKWQAWPVAAVTPAYVTKATAPDALTQNEGSVVRQAMLAGEPVTPNKIVRSDSTGFMAAMLTAGMRAVSVKLSVETGAGGFILPNDRVDVILTSENETGRGRSSRTILANVRVLAIDQTFQGEGDNKVVIGKTATLELTPTQAEVITRAEASGTVNLVLRSLSDYDPSLDGDHPESVGAMTIIRYGNATEVNVNGAGK